MNGSRRIGAAAIISLLLIGGSGPAAAWALASSTTADGEPKDRVDEFMVKHNLHPAFEKLGRGVSNALGGCLEIPLNIHQRYAQSDTSGSMLTGLAHGLFKGVVRTGVGLYETVTFFLPYPEDYRPILPTLAYFQRAKRAPLPLE